MPLHSAEAVWAVSLNRRSISLVGCSRSRCSSATCLQCCSLPARIFVASNSLQSCCSSSLSNRSWALSFRSFPCLFFRTSLALRLRCSRRWWRETFRRDIDMLSPSGKACWCSSGHWLRGPLWLLNSMLLLIHRKFHSKFETSQGAAPLYYTDAVHSILRL